MLLPGSCNTKENVRLGDSHSDIMSDTTALPEAGQWLSTLSLGDAHNTRDRGFA